MRYLTGVGPVHTSKALLIVRPFQYEKPPPVRDEQGLWFISLFPPPEQNRGFPWGTGIYSIQPEQYRKLRYLPMHLLLLLTAHSVQFPKE